MTDLCPARPVAANLPGPPHEVDARLERLLGPLTAAVEVVRGPGQETPDFARPLVDAVEALRDELAALLLEQQGIYHELWRRQVG